MAFYPAFIAALRKKKLPFLAMLCYPILVPGPDKANSKSDDPFIHRLHLYKTVNKLPDKQTKTNTTSQHLSTKSKSSFIFCLPSPIKLVLEKLTRPTLRTYIRFFSSILKSER